jgi:uncharacterized protein (DUF2249 family)
MPEMNVEDFKFPDEKQESQEQEEQFEVEIEDDTPPEDRGREPMPKPLVEELEQDELDQYDDNVKQKLKQMRKVWHDERARRKEQAAREQQEALALAQKLFEENKKYKQYIESGTKEYASTLKNAANLELEMAKRKYKDAYDTGDSDQIMEASQVLQTANLRVMQANNFQAPALQEENYVVQNTPEVQKPRARNPKLETWLQKNPWYGPDPEMTALAVGIDKKIQETGNVVVGSDEYFATLDKTMRKRFPEYFGIEETESTARTETRSKPSTVVAPAVRSTASNKIKLKSSQVAIAKRLGLTNEQYALELRRLESQNG